MEPQQETRDEKPLTFADIGIPTGPKLEEGALGKVRYSPNVVHAWRFISLYSDALIC